MDKHPNGSYIFVWVCNIIALILIYINSVNLSQYNISELVTFFVWTIILCYGRLNGFFKIINVKATRGWASSLEFAAILILPFPLLSLCIIISGIVIIIDRISKNHPKPFFGPDFNVSNILISGYIAKFVFEWASTLFSNTYFSSFLPLLLSSVIYIILEMVLLTTLLSIDMKKPWLKVDLLTLESIISETVLVFTGAIIGFIYRFDPLLLALMIVPLLMLYNLLIKINNANLVYYDEKTGIYNYRYYDEKIEQFFHVAKKQNIPMSVIFCDMDHLREVNNKYGHVVGDKALITIGSILKDIKSESIIPARFGGEEFVVLLIGYNKSQAYEIAEKIRIQVQKTAIMLDSGEPINITISLGVSSYPEESNSVERLVVTADEALYLAKHRGKNKTVLYSNIMHANV